MVDRVGDWRRGVADCAAWLRAASKAADRAGLHGRAETFDRMADGLFDLQPPADLKDRDDDRWKPENFAPLVDGVEYRR